MKLQTAGNRSILTNFLSIRTFLRWIDESMQFGDFCVLNTLLLAQINFRMCFVYFLEGHLFKTFWYGDVFRQKITFFYPLIEFLRENLATRKQNLGKWTCFIKSSVLYLNHRTFLG